MTEQQKKLLVLINSFSKNGQVYSYPKNNSRNMNGRILKSYIGKRGYLCTNFGYMGNKIKLIHRLIANAFIPNPENKPQINHKDGNKLNNKISNLEWATSKENIRHSMATGLNKMRHECIMTDEQVLKMRTMFKDGISINRIANFFQIKYNTAFHIVKGRYYKWVEVINE